MKINFYKFTRIFFIAFFISIFAFICDAFAGDKWMIGFDYGISSVSDISFDGKYHSYQGAYSLRENNSILLNFGTLWGDDGFWYGGFFIGLKYRFFPEKTISPFVQARLVNIIAPIVGIGIDITLDSKAVIPISLQFGILGISLREVYIISAGFGFRF